MTAAAPAPYLGPYPIRDNVTCADFDDNGVLGTKVGDARVWLSYHHTLIKTGHHHHHKDLSWVMRISENGRVRHLMLGPNNARMRQVWRADAAPQKLVQSQYPIVMVGGVAFLVDEAVALYALFTNALPQSAAQ
jgi:hypothetical protein